MSFTYNFKRKYKNKNNKNHKTLFIDSLNIDKLLNINYDNQSNDTYEINYERLHELSTKFNIEDGISISIDNKKSISQQIYENYICSPKYDFNKETILYQLTNKWKEEEWDKYKIKTTKRVMNNNKLFKLK